MAIPSHSDLKKWEGSNNINYSRVTLPLSCMSDPKQIELLLRCDAARNKAAWDYFLDSDVTLFRGCKTVRIAEWVRAFVVDGLVPMMRRYGFTVQAKIDTNLLYWLYAVCRGYRHLPSPKHRNLDSDRWIFEQKIGRRRWDALIDSYGVFELFDVAVDPYIRENLSEFVYIHILPEDSLSVYDDDSGENKMGEDARMYYSDDD